MIKLSKILVVLEIVAILMIVGCSDPTKTIENNISNGNNNSENDIIWKDVSANLPPGNSNIPIYNLKYLNSMFFVCNMHYIHSSSDLIKWTGKDFIRVSYNVDDILSIGYGNDRYIESVYKVKI